MNSNAKTYCWSAAVGLATFALGVIVMYFDMHPVTTKQILTVITFPLCLAVFVSAGLNLKLKRPPERKYYWRMLAGFAGYALGLVALNYFDGEHMPHRRWLVILPVLPTIYLVTVIMSCVSNLDEMKRKIVVEAMAFAGLATGFTSFSYLFLRDMGAPEFRPEWALYILWAWYWVGLFFSWRRYW